MRWINNQISVQIAGQIASIYSSTLHKTFPPIFLIEFGLSQQMDAGCPPHAPHEPPFPAHHFSHFFVVILQRVSLIVQQGLTATGIHESAVKLPCTERFFRQTIAAQPKYVQHAINVFLVGGSTLFSSCNMVYTAPDLSIFHCTGQC